MTVNELSSLAERYMNLGGAVQKQFQKIIHNLGRAGQVPLSYALEDINPNALVMIKDFLGHLAELYDEEELGDEAIYLLVEIDEAESELANLSAPLEV